MPLLDQYIQLIMEKPKVWKLNDSNYALIADYQIFEGVFNYLI